MIELVKIQSSKQKIALIRDPKFGLMLILDEAIQFTERSEVRYHESLGIVPMLFCKPQNVFIGGGGDGLVAARLLKFPEIECVVLCDYDHSVTDLASTYPDLVALNSGSLSDPRVKVINEDAVNFLENTNEKFGLMICDFPDPVTKELGQLYSQSFYDLAKHRLSENGVICIQTLMLEQSCALIINTVRRVFPHTLFYRTYYRGRGMTGFTLAGKRPLKRKRLTPSWTRYLDESVVDTLFVIPRDECFQTDKVNTIENNLLSRATLLGQYWHIASEPYPYNPNYRMVYLDQTNSSHQNLLPDFIHYCNEVYPLILYVNRTVLPKYKHLLDELGYKCSRIRRLMSYRFTPSNRRRIEEWWYRLNNATITDIEASYCRSNEKPEIAILFQDYLKSYPERFLDIDENYDVLSHTRLHFIVRNKDGRAVMLLVFDLGDVITCEIIYGRGSARENMLAVLLSLRFFEREYRPLFYFEAATKNVENFMFKLGADHEKWFEIYTKEG